MHNFDDLASKFKSVKLSKDKQGNDILKIYRSKNREKMGQLGRSKIEEVFNLEHCVDEYEKIYLENI